MFSFIIFCRSAATCRYELNLSLFWNLKDKYWPFPSWKTSNKSMRLTCQAYACGELQWSRIKKFGITKAWVDSICKPGLDRSFRALEPFVETGALIRINEKYEWCMPRVRAKLGASKLARLEVLGTTYSGIDDIRYIMFQWYDIK